MDKQRANILQIQKYLNGELDAKAMHQLEREAQHDPFLMDALEGYQTIGSNQQANLDILAKQLNQRTEQKQRRIIPWTTISIAAGVIGFMVVVGLLYKGTNTENQLKTAQVTELPKAKAANIDSSAIAMQMNARQRASLEADKQAKLSASLRREEDGLATNKTISPAKPAAPVTHADFSLAEVVLLPAAGAKADSTRTPLDEMVIGSVSASRVDSVAMPLTVELKKRPISQPLPGKADGVTSDPKRPTSAYDLNKYLPGYQPAAANNNNNAVPLQGITAKADDKPINGLTNAKGYLAAPATAQNQTANIGYSGFGNQRTITTTDSLNVAALNTKLPVFNNAANNTTATINTDNTDEDVDPTSAHPAKGWMAFRVYIAKNSYLPTGDKTGMVEVKFTVDAAGKISNIKVTNSLSPTADKKAISLIIKGPKWKGNANGKAQEITQRIGFVNKK